HYLYGQSPDLPSFPFCTDEDIFTDPNCVQFDTPSPTPLGAFQIPRYQRLIGLLLHGQVSPAFTRLVLASPGSQLLAYARAGTPDEAITAWIAGLGGIRAPLPAQFAADPVYAAAAGAISASVFRGRHVQPVG